MKYSKSGTLYSIVCENLDEDNDNDGMDHDKNNERSYKYAEKRTLNPINRSVISDAQASPSLENLFLGMVYSQIP